MNTRILTKIIAFLTAIVLASVALTACMVPAPAAPLADADKYAEALDLLVDGDYEGAKAIFEALGDYEDSEKHLERFHYVPTSYVYDLEEATGFTRVYFNSDGLPVRELAYREGIGERTCRFTYDENGAIINQIVIDEAGVSTITYTYDAKGRRATADYVGADGYCYEYVFTYDEFDRVKRSTFTNNLGANGEFYYEYGEKGNVIREGFTSPEYSYEYNIEAIFDENGRLLKESCTYPDGEVDTIDYTYDEEGRVTVKKYTELDDNEVHLYEYTYDKNGNLVKETYTNDEGLVQYVEYEYALFYMLIELPVGTVQFFEEYWHSFFNH